MKNKFLLIFFLSLLLSSCIGVSSKGIFGTGVSVAFDPRSVGTQVDDSIMQKSLTAKILIRIFFIQGFQVIESHCLSNFQILIQNLINWIS